VVIGGFLGDSLFFTVLFLVCTICLNVMSPLRGCRTRRGLCPSCGYPIGRNALCTECGTPLPIDNQT
jgi:hypothetical protein